MDGAAASNSTAVGATGYDDLVISGVISGGFAVSKYGPGHLQLAPNAASTVFGNTYTGATNDYEGVLEFNATPMPAPSPSPAPAKPPTP